MQSIYRYTVLVVIAIIIINIVGCSTNKNTWVSRHYQMLTSNYNVYYNGIEAFNEGIKNIRETYKNDYSHVLPVYEFSDATAAKSGSSDMETALKKGHKLIQLHSITTKPKRKDKPSEKYKKFASQEEFNPYIADSYLLLGKANVVRHEDDEAIEYFDYLSRKYEGKEPCYEGKIWKSIAYVQKGMYGNSISALESYDLDGLAPIKLYPEYMAAYANIYISQKMYKEAIPYMEAAAKEISDHHCKRRYKYILAQLYREIGDKGKAAPLFLELSKGLSDYDMAFAAKLDLATVASTPEELALAEKKLKKMATDEKNNDQLDQIYYSLGKMEENKGEYTSAINDYRKSIEKSIDNDNQKGLSFLALSDLYITEPKYIETSESLDSAAFYLDDSNLRKEETKLKSKKFQPLAVEMRMVRDQDSLLRIANMDSKTREKFVKDIVEKYEKERKAAEEAREAMEEEGMTQSDFYQLTSQRSGGSREMSKWYFYNTTMVSAGKSTFITRWGRRKNEDNWRRSDKSSMSIQDMEEQFGEQNDSTKKIKQQTDNQNTIKEGKGPITFESLMANVPLTDEAKAEANKKIDNALFNSGAILYEDIKDYKSAEKQLKRELTDYPKSSNRYNSLVLLYFTQIKEDDIAAATETAQIIKREFGSSSFADYLRSNNYFDLQKAKREEKDQRYERTYNAYLSGQYNEAIASATSALNDTTNKEYYSKYLLIRSLAYAKDAQTMPFKADLISITERYSGTQEDSLAQQFLAHLNAGQTPIKAMPYQSPMAETGKYTETKSEPTEFYTFRADTTQTILCLIDFGMQNRAQFVIADYNFTNYLIEDFDIRIQKISDEHQAILIEGFSNAKTAMTYYYALREQSFWKELTQESVPQIFVVSDNNIRAVILSDLGNNYEQFFKQNYF